jgi:hypothetical protein
VQPEPLGATLHVPKEEEKRKKKKMKIVAVLMILKIKMMKGEEEEAVASNQAVARDVLTDRLIIQQDFYQVVVLLMT